MDKKSLFLEFYKVNDIFLFFQERQETVAAVLNAHSTTLDCCLTPTALQLKGKLENIADAFSSLWESSKKGGGVMSTEQSIHKI